MGLCTPLVQWERLMGLSTPLVQWEGLMGLFTPFVQYIWFLYYTHNTVFNVPLLYFTY